VWSIDYNNNMKEIIVYNTENGKSPYDIWFSSLDNFIRARIIKRLERIKEGNYGDWKKIDSDISEFRFKFGSGYRIYFSEIDNVIILLLCAGDKSTQAQDIKKAKEYLSDLQERIF